MSTKQIKARIPGGASPAAAVEAAPSRGGKTAAANPPRTKGRDKASMRQRRAGFDITQADQQLEAHSRTWRERLVRYRLPLLLGGGLLGGMALAILSRRRGWGLWAP